MTFNENDLAELKKALVSGVTSMTINGRSVTFRSLSEIKQIIGEIEASIKLQENANDPNYTLPTPNKVTARFSKYPIK